MRLLFRVQREGVLGGEAVRPGDVVSVDPGDAQPVLVIRPLSPDYRALYAAEADGLLSRAPVSPVAPPVTPPAPRVLVFPSGRRPTALPPALGG